MRSFIFALTRQGDHGIFLTMKDQGGLVLTFVHGYLHKDPSDIWQYVAKPEADINAAAAEALEQHRAKKSCVMHFWHLNTFVPVNVHDTTHMLVARYQTWRFEFLGGNRLSILRLISSHAGLGKPILERSAS